MDPIRILVVEDESIVGRDIQNTLTKIGYHVPDVVNSGERAVRLAQSSRPDLVIMDIQLSGFMDGIDAGRRIMQTQKIPVVYLTGSTDEETISRARETGPLGMLLKPFNHQELQTMVESALAQHKQRTLLKQSEQRFVSTLKSLADGVIATDLVGTVTFLNPVAQELTGWTTEDAVGRPLTEVFSISYPSGKVAEPLASDEDTSDDGGRMIMLTTRSGDLVPIEDNTAPISDDDGSLSGLVVVFRRRAVEIDREVGDLTERKRSDPAWSHLVGLMQSISDPLFALDEQWGVTYANTQAASYFGKDREQLIGSIVWEHFPKSVHSRYYQEFYDCLMKKEGGNFELHNEPKRSWADVHIYPFDDGLLVFLKDITARKTAEDHQSKVEKLESLGFLARGFAHDFNNLLTVLLGNLSLADMKIAPEAEYKPEVEAAKQATMQAKNLVHQLLTFAKGGAPIRSTTDVAHLVDTLVRDHDKFDRISYDVKIDTGLGTCDLDPDQISRLIGNLIRNAEQAISDSGHVMVGAKRVARTNLPSGLFEADQGEQESYIHITVEDDGEGISDENRSQVFEPYFSTRQQANATGLGLTVCESIAKAHQGNLTIESRLGEGTIVHLYLPANASASVSTTSTNPAPVAEEPQPTAAPDRVKRVLVLEDEPLIRRLLVANLQGLGHEVDETDEGSVTIERYRDAFVDGQRYDLVVMDLSIPDGMGGAQAMEQLLKIDRDVVAIVSSGYSDDPVMSRYMDYGFKAVLPKPYSPEKLAELVQELLG